MSRKVIKKKWPLIIISLFLSVFILYEVGFRINITESMPVGIYYLCAPDDLRNGDLVAVKLPPDLISIGLKRGYIKSDETILLKRLIAVPNDKIIYKNEQISVNGISKYKCIVKDIDLHERVMPNSLKEGIYTLGNNEYFVLGNNDDSWDSRYFGSVNKENIINRAKMIIAF